MTNDGVSPLSQVVEGGQLSEDCVRVLEELSTDSDFCEGCSGGGASQSMGAEGARVGGAIGSPSISEVESDDAVDVLRSSCKLSD